MNKFINNIAVYLYFLLIFIILALIMGCRDKNKDDTREKIEELFYDTHMPIIISKLPVVTIYVDSYGGSSAIDGPEVILMVWKDGDVIWSKNDIEGGQPYFEGKISEQRLENFFDYMNKNELYESHYNNHEYSIFDAPYTKILIFPDANFLDMKFSERLGNTKSNLKLFEIISCHELFEADPNFVATSRGVELLDGRNRQDVLSQQPAGHLEYRKFWSELRQELKSLIPEEGKTIGDLRFYLKSVSITKSRMKKYNK